MNLFWKVLGTLGRGLSALAVFVAMAVGWTLLVFFFSPWFSAESNRWPSACPIIVGSAETGQTRVILYHRFAAEQKADPTLVPWPLVPAGTGQEGQVRTAWQSVAGKAWRYEARWDDGDYILESRYRLDGTRPVLVESRRRDPSLGLIGILLALFTLVIWKAVQWWQQRRCIQAGPQ